MQLVETITVGSGGAASIEFTSIPQDADDLLLVVSGRSTFSASSDVVKMEFNSVTTGYTLKRLVGTGSSTSSSSNTFQIGAISSGATSTANTFGSSSIYIPNYTSSTAKSSSTDTVSENNATDAIQYLVANNSTTTAAITSIKVFTNSGNFVEHSTASLYKIVKA